MGTASRVIELRGHIIDSLTFPKVLDEILDHGADYETEEISIGRTRRDTSRARIRVTAPWMTVGVSANSAQATSGGARSGVSRKSNTGEVFSFNFWR